MKTNELIDNISKVIVGKEETIELLLTCMLAGGHVLLEDIPGTGKTKLARSIAASCKADFKRIQFTPDLLPSDVTGLNVYDAKQNEFVLKKGPVFTSILLADEINRATPRTQAGLLECMEERQVTVDGESVKLTPIEYNILLLLVKNPGKVYSIDDIYEQIWNEEAIGADNTVAVHIRHIREKIEIDPRNPRYLKVVWGRGYKIEKISGGN